ncbi:MAG: hypothetical protein NXH94_21000 [Rhodobacteraceae bacterium]|nr:hypothetical protein [Paracoccaceae bacterium]
MHKILVLMLAFLGFGIPHVLAANNAVIRGGEHGSFTRITISTTRDIEGFQKNRLPDGTEKLILSPGFSSVDLSRLFDRLSADRLKAIVPSGNALEFSLKCHCDVLVSRHSEKLLVVDITERTEEPGVSIPVLPKKSGTFPLSILPAPNRRDLFGVDHALVRKISRTVASQINQSAHIHGFSMMAKADSLGDEKALPVASNGYSRSEHIDRCHWSEVVWEEVVNQSQNEGSFSNDRDNIDAALLAQEDGTIGSALAVSFLALGLVEEAYGAFLLTEPDGPALNAFEEFVQALKGAAAVKSGRLGDCNPLEDFLISTSQNSTEIPQSRVIDTLTVFSDLPLGLKLLLYPRMDRLLDERSLSGFDDLAAHLAGEKALSERVPDVVSNEDEVPDPDGLAAVSIELRQTPNEVDSWLVAFASLLEHRRYFDALDALAAGPRISSEQKTAKVREFINHLTDHADSVTFLQVTLTALPDLKASVSIGSSQNVAERLKKEGFREHAMLFENEVVMPKSIDAEGTGTVEDVSAVRPQMALRRDPQEEQLNPAAKELANGWTVAIAQEYLDRAKSVRQILTDALAQ